MANKNQRRKRAPSKRKAKPRLKLPPPASVLYGKLGAVADPNKLETTTSTPSSKDPGVTWAEKPRKPSAPANLSAFKKAYILKLTAKHKNDFQAMARDRKANKDQLTATQLEKMWNKLQLEGETSPDN